MTKKNANGWRRLGNAGRTWVPDQDDSSHVLQGTIQGRRAIKTKFDTKKDDFTTIIDIAATVESHDSEGVIGEGEIVNVFESATLKPLLDLDIGSEVRLTPRGLGQKKKGQNAPKLFDVEVHDG